MIILTRNTDSDLITLSVGTQTQLIPTPSIAVDSAAHSQIRTRNSSLICQSSSSSSGGMFKCPEDGKPLDYAKLYPDREAQVEILNGVVRCSNAGEGCRWVDNLHCLQAHLDTCLYKTVSCPNGCSTRLLRFNLEDHVEYLCSKRRVECDFCCKGFPGDYMDEIHEGNCPKEITWCENKCGAQLERRFLSNHMKKECHKRTVNCQYCDREFVFETLQTHQYQCPRYPVSCPNRCDPTKIPREEVDVHVLELCPSATMNCPFQEAGCMFKCPRYSMDQHIEESQRVHLMLAWDLVRRQQVEISHLCDTLHTSCHTTDGTFVWNISSYKAKYIDALCHNNNGKELISQSFYSSQFGYKTAISIFLNGNGAGEGKYLSVYIKLLPGEYDNILEWPFRLPVSFTLFDQHSDSDMRSNLTESFLPESTWKHFQKPTNGVEPVGFGFPKFVSHQVLKTRDYIRDDCVIMKVNMDTKGSILL